MEAHAVWAHATLTQEGLVGVIRKKIKLEVRPKRALVPLGSSREQFECLACGAHGVLPVMWPLGIASSTEWSDPGALRHRADCSVGPAASAKHAKLEAKVVRE